MCTQILYMYNIFILADKKSLTEYTSVYLEGMSGSAEIFISFYMYFILFLQRGREIFVMAECLANLSPAVM